MPLPIALQLYSVREAAAAQGYEAAVRRVAAMGYDGVEPAGFPGSNAQAAGKLFRELGLQVPSAHTPVPLGEKQSQVFEDMEAIGCKVVVSGFGPDQFKTADLIKQSCERFNQAAEACKAHGLVFGIHNHWWEYQQVDGRYVYETMLELLDPSIIFEIDTYWVKTAGVDPAAVVRQMGARAPLLHIKDGPAQRDVPMMAAGEGVLDFPTILEAGKGHTEWLIVELDRCATDMFEAVDKSVKYLQKIR
jgi:sugar phosphate isomerase/epimerase